MGEAEKVVPGEPMPFDRDTPCPACGIQLSIVGVCREAHHGRAGMTMSGAALEHLHVTCPGCGWGAVMETATQAAARRPTRVPAELRGFIADGRLVSIPARAGRRRAALRHIAERTFEPQRTYREPEVNVALAAWHPDVASLRRYLVDEGFMHREHGLYELLPTEEPPST